jgi:hypothetical protein
MHILRIRTGAWTALATLALVVALAACERDPVVAARPVADPPAPAEIDPPSPEPPATRITLTKSGAIGSLAWRDEERVVAGPYPPKPLVPNARVVHVEDLRARFQLSDGGDVDLRFTPVEDGYDLEIAVNYATDPAIDIFLGDFATHGPTHALLPTWAGSIRSISFPKDTGPVYEYPGTSYAPVMAIWDERTTVGYSILAQVGDRVSLQLFSASRGDPLVRLKYRLHTTGEQHFTRRVSVRFAEGPERWRETLEPYRLHQLERDGPVRYEHLGPWVSVNMRNLHAYDFNGSRNFRPGSTWENTLGAEWEPSLRRWRDGALRMGCIGVWSQMEQVDPGLTFNPDVLDLEKSLDGSLPTLVQRVRNEYDPPHISVFSRPDKKIVDGELVRRDLHDPTEWVEIMTTLRGLRELGFDVAYADELGAHGGWRAVQLCEEAPLRLVPEWAWDRLMTRASCLMAHPRFPTEQAALLVPWLTPGAELFVIADASRRPLFAEGNVTPWHWHVSDHNYDLWNELAAGTRVSSPDRHAVDDGT